MKGNKMKNAKKLNPFEGKEIWFFVGSQDLYGPETLEQVAEQSEVIANALDSKSQIPAKIVLKPTLKSSDAILKAFHSANSAEQCIGIILWMHTFSPAKMWIKGLEVNTKPLLQLNTQANIEIPWSEIDMDFMNLNQAAHGDREFGYIVSRLDINRKIVIGHHSDEKVASAIGKWVRAAAGWDALHHLNVCRIGDNMRNVAVTEGDKTEAEKVFGCSVNTWGVNELIAKVEAVKDSEIEELIDDYLESYDVDDDLKKGGAKHSSLIEAARIEAGLRALLEENNSLAFTDTFEDLGALRQLPGLAVQRLMADGYGFGAEGDWKTAVLVRLAKVMGYGLDGGASLMEDYTYNLVPGKEAILGAHMLEVCPSLTKEKPKLEVHPLGIGGKEDPVRLVFAADEKKNALVVGLSDMRDRFRMVANLVNVIKPYHPLPKLPVACALWQPAPSLDISAQCWLEAGAPHHTAMTTAVDREIFEDFARIAGVELDIIDWKTQFSDFEQNLKVNKVYYKFDKSF
ncbi:MAG: L-arabinose isomerase [Bifidobacteriaceae bacterium]|jgi:L-arabinose isomerase|nr:L-arabinose isomerase [Bifidobacteriaceae bacterium]